MTYANFVCNICLLKSEPYCVKLVVVGNKLEYLDDVGSSAASLLEIKLMVNSVISEAQQGACFLSTDLKDFFLATPMAHPFYMKIHCKHIPKEIIDQYQLEDKFHNNYIYVKIKKGMYSLNEATILAYQHLINNLAPLGYKPIPYGPPQNMLSIVNIFLALFNWSQKFQYCVLSGQPIHLSKAESSSFRMMHSDLFDLISEFNYDF